MRTTDVSFLFPQKNDWIKDKLPARQMCLQWEVRGDRMRPEPGEQPVGSFTLGGDPCWSAVFACSVLLWIHEERPSPLPMHHSSWIFRQRLQLLHLINQGLKAHLFHTETQGGKNKVKTMTKMEEKALKVEKMHIRMHVTSDYHWTSCIVP